MMGRYFGYFPGWLGGLILLSLPGLAQIDVQRTSPKPKFIEGLGGKVIEVVVKDHQGFMWFGSEKGLFRFDGNHLKRYFDGRRDRDLSVNALAVGLDGQLWVGTSGGLYRYRSEFDAFQLLEISAELANASVAYLFPAKDGSLWVEGAFGLIRMVQSRVEPVETDSWGAVQAVLEDGASVQWVGTSHGLFRGNLTEGFKPVVLGESILKLLLDRTGTLWVLSSAGLAYFNESEERLVYILDHVEYTSFALIEDEVFVCGFSREKSYLGIIKERQPQFFELDHHKSRVKNLFYFNDGIAWIGGVDSVGFFDLDQFRFETFKHKVWALFADERGLFFGGDGVAFRPWGAQSFRPIEILGVPGKESTSDKVNAIVSESDGTIWIGTELGLVRLDNDLGNPRRYFLGKREYVWSNFIYSLELDRNQRLWIGSTTGLLRLQSDKKSFEPIAYSDGAFHSQIVTTLAAGRDDKMWVGSFSGLYSVNTNSLDVQHITTDVRPSRLPDNEITSLAESSDGDLWVGKLGGFLHRRYGADNFEIYTSEDGIEVAEICGFLEESADLMWISTDNGLYRFDRKRDVFTRFNKYDGLQTDNFFQEARCKTPDGRFYFSGPGGVTGFDPKGVVLEEKLDKLSWVSLSLSNEPVDTVIQDSDSPLPQALQFLDSISLKPHQRRMTLQVGTMHYRSGSDISFVYEMDNLDDGRQIRGSVTSNAYVSFNNLKWGNYRLRAKGRVNSEEWIVSKPLDIRIQRPLWARWWAYTIYVLTVCGIVLGYLFLQRQKLKAEQDAVKRMEYLDRLKDEFLANTSHELRTPLNGVIGLAESMLAGASGTLSRLVKENLTMVASSAHRLANLVNDILDFSRMRHGDLSLSPRALDLKSTVDVVLAMSTPLVGNKPLRLKNELPELLPHVLADENRVQQILYNLVGNAIKFTASGTVVLGGEEGSDGFVAVWVADTGMGIDPADQERIFQSFQQVDGSIQRGHGGTGLGLAVTRQLVELHGGRIWLESQPGQGSRFTFTLPKSDTPAPAIEQTQLLHRVHGSDSEDDIMEQMPTAQGKTLLLVDDEPVNLQVLRNYLKPLGFRLLEAQDGLQGLALLERESVDLVVLDIMMPGLSGYEVCEKIRETYPIQDLPIIMLTALSRVEDLVAAYDAGANDYLNKPILRKVLIARLETHLQLLESTRDLERKVVEKTDQLNRHREQLVAREKMGFLEAIARGMAHEIQNPLNFVNNMVELNVELVEELEEHLEGDGEAIHSLKSLKQYLEMAKDDGGRVSSVIGSLREYGKNPFHDSRMEVDVNDLLGRYSRVMRAQLKDPRIQGIILKDSYQPSLEPWMTVPTALAFAYSQLVKNALESCLEKMDQKGESYRGLVEIRSRGNGQQIIIEVEDNGMGLPEDIDIFVPFATTKDNPANLGLGLALALEFVRDVLRGTLRCQQGKEGGACFTITLAKL